MDDSKLEEFRKKYNQYDPDEVPHIDYRDTWFSSLSKRVRRNLGLIYHKLKSLKIRK